MDPASRWNVVLEHLNVNSIDANGEAWDAFGGAPDPFVEVRVGTESATASRTGTTSDTFDVTYDGRPTSTNQRADSLLAYLDFYVWDEDATSNDPVGRCYTTVTEPVFGGTTQTVNCARNPSSGNAGFTLTWHLERY